MGRPASAGQAEWAHRITEALQDAEQASRKIPALSAVAVAIGEARLRLKAVHFVGHVACTRVAGDFGCR
jgi:hypothetical protein